MNFKPVANLPECVNDARNFLDFLLHDLGLDIQNDVYLLCSPENVSKICRKIKFKGDGAEESKEQCIYFYDA